MNWQDEIPQPSDEQYNKFLNNLTRYKMIDLEKETKDARIEIRINKDVKRKFLSYCKEVNKTASQVLTGLIENASKKSK